MSTGRRHRRGEARVEERQVRQGRVAVARAENGRGARTTQRIVIED
jgi:hypothetical protein